MERNDFSFFADPTLLISLNVSLSRNELESDESATLTIEIRGTGNTKLVDLPSVSIPDDLETYDPKYSERLNIASKGYKGFKKEEYLIIPRYKGVYKIPALSFSYFDLATEKYVTLKSEPLELNVLSGPENTNINSKQSSLSSAQKNDVQILNNDILFIKTEDLALEKESVPFYETGIYKGLLYLGLAGLLLPWFIFGAKNKMEKMGVFKAKNSDLKAIKKAIQNAEEAHASSNQEKVLSSVHRSLQLIITAVTGFSSAESEKSAVEKALKKKNVSEQDTKKLIGLWEKIEFARFAPVKKEDESQMISDVKTVFKNLFKS